MRLASLAQRAAVTRMLSPAQLEEAACILCGPAPARTRIDAHPFRVVECEGCTLVYLSPRLAPDSREAIYTGDYFKSPIARERGYTDYVADRDCYLETFRRRARPLLEWRPRGTVFEAGFAAGFFLRVMRDAGWRTFGVELNPDMVAHARNELALDDVTHGRIEDWDGREAPYDLITLWDVLEHVGDPGALLARLREWLAPDGRLVIETQDVSSPTARLLGKRWHHYKHGEHLFHFSPRTLRTLLERAGFEVIDFTRRGAGKVIPYRFLVERSERLFPPLTPVLARLPGLDSKTFYVNPHDEMIVTARLRRPR